MEITTLIDELMLHPAREAVASELAGTVPLIQPFQLLLTRPSPVLQSIYGDDAIHIREPIVQYEEGMTLRYEVSVTLPSQSEYIEARVLVSLPPTYPATSPPQLQLLSKYIGPFGLDAGLFGAVLRTFISSSGVEWSPDTVCVFDGLQSVVERCENWYGEQLSVRGAGELAREDARATYAHISHPPREDVPPTVPRSLAPPVPQGMPEGVEIFESETITDRKSAFVGRACHITDPAQVPQILAHLLADRRIARAAHPVINAWRCRAGAIVHQDNDDDGESAAGARLAHLLQILDLSNVLVVVTRYFGGIHLGPDRFKHINAAARGALEAGGFLDEAGGDEGRKGKKKR
ncbi:hypothetical protein HWV62_24532 [Athelia sp. TMB]|nr:hypothetical protein HWV62_24532 [Athelia sp. TMB]